MAYTPQQIQQAMRRAMADGNQAAVDDLRQRLTEAYQAEAPKATEGMSGFQKLRAGAGQGIVNTGRQLANMVGLRSDEQLADDKARDADLLSTGAGRTGAFIGEMAATAPLGLGAGGLAVKAAPRLGMTARALLAGGMEGAAQGAVAGGPGDRLGSAVQGAAMGAAMPVGGAVLRRAARPLRSTKDAQYLINEGVRLTPGELNPTGKLNQWEQALQSSAFGGTTISNARRGAQHDFRQALGTAAGPDNFKMRRGLSDEGMINELEAAYAKGYGGALDKYEGALALDPHIYRPNTTMPLHTYPGTGGGPRGAMVEASRAHYPGSGVKPSARSEMLGVLEDELSFLPAGQKVTGRDLQLARSNIRKAARGNDVPGERAILRGGEGKITEALESQILPKDMDALRALDAKYGNFKIFQDAVARAKDMPGGITPANIETSIAKMTDLGEYARGGGGPLRPLARAARSVFEQRSAPTGERQVLTGFLGRLGTPFVGGTLALGTKVPTKVLAGMTPMQRKMQSKLRALRRKHGTDLETARAFGTAYQVQREKQQEERGED